MARRGLTNFIRGSHVLDGHETWKLKTLEGEPVLAFDCLCEKNADYSFRKQKRYAEVAARFIDYLYAAQVFNLDVQPSRLNAVVEAYPILLRTAPTLCADRFVSFLADERHIAASTHLQALHALPFIYKEVLDLDLPRVSGDRSASASQANPGRAGRKRESAPLGVVITGDWDCWPRCCTTLGCAWRRVSRSGSRTLPSSVS